LFGPPPAGDIPKQDRGVVAARRQRLTVGGKSQRLDWPAMAVKRTALFAGDNFPELDNAIGTAAGQHSAVGRKNRAGRRPTEAAGFGSQVQLEQQLARSGFPEPYGFFRRPPRAELRWARGAQGRHDRAVWRIR